MGIFTNNGKITKFNELKYFKNATMTSGCFNGCTALKEVDGINSDGSGPYFNNGLSFKNCPLEKVKIKTKNGYTLLSFLDSQSLDLRGTNTSSCTNMSLMFKSCGLVTYIDTGDLDTHACKDFNMMFMGCKKLESIDVSGFNTSACNRMDNMFNSCNALTSLDLSNFDTSACTNISGMFDSCNALTSLDLSNFDTSACTDMHSLCYNANSLLSLDLSNFDTSACTNISGMFSYCKNVNSFKVSAGFFNAATRSDSPLTTFDLSGLSAWVNVTEITNMLNALPTATATLKLSTNTKNVINSNSLASIATDKGWTIA